MNFQTDIEKLLADLTQILHSKYSFRDVYYTLNDNILISKEYYDDFTETFINMNINKGYFYNTYFLTIDDGFETWLPWTTGSEKTRKHRGKKVSCSLSTIPTSFRDLSELMFITGVGKEVIDLCKNFITSHPTMFNLCTGHPILTSNFILEQSDGVNFQTSSSEFSNIDLEASIYACLFFKALVTLIYQ
jgi:hypothetical protein